MKVLSLFDGMSCTQIALEKLGVNVEKYYASELDKFAIKVTQDNYPNTVQLGDVTKVNGHELGHIDLLVGGSPCQGFSFAGKQLNFKDERSKLFFEYVRILKELREVNPSITFLLENVRMKKESQDIISKYLGVEPLVINSNLVSAQNRHRLYWTNIEGIEQPENKNIQLKDILENECFTDREKSHCLDANYFKGGNLKSYFGKGRRQLIFNNLEAYQVGVADVKGHDFLKRVYDIDFKSPTLTAVCGGNQERKIAINENQWRKLTPIECERLQTVPDNYTKAVSNTQRYKMLGNGFTVDVISHILSYAL